MIRKPVKNPIKRRNSSKDDDRKKQLNEYLKSGGKVKKYDYVGPQNTTFTRKGDLKHDYRCNYCNGYERDGEFEHDYYCPTVTRSKKKPDRGEDDNMKWETVRIRRKKCFKLYEI